MEFKTILRNQFKSSILQSTVRPGSKTHVCEAAHYLYLETARSNTHPEDGESWLGGIWNSQEYSFLYYKCCQVLFKVTSPILHQWMCTVYRHLKQRTRNYMALMVPSQWPVKGWTLEWWNNQLDPRAPGCLFCICWRDYWTTQWAGLTLSFLSCLALYYALWIGSQMVLAAADVVL